MNRVQFVSGVSLLLATLLPAGPALAGDAVDTRVTFTLADDDVMRGPDESSGATPSPSIPNSQPSGNNRLFFDDFERRDKGFENLTHLVLYTHQPGFFEGLDTEAALVLRAEVLWNKKVALTDDGSYLRLTKDLGNDLDMMVTAFPISADRFALGYSYDISWGGRDIFKYNTASPGLRLDLKSDFFYFFLGGKTALLQVMQPDGTIEQDTGWGLLGGAGIDVADELRIEGNGGGFYRGFIDKPTLIKEKGGRVIAAPWYGYGGSVQVSYHVGMPIGTPVDFRLYKNDPLKRDAFAADEPYDGGLSFAVQSEASMLGQTLMDPERPSSTVDQIAFAADLTGKVKIGNLRCHALAVTRNLAFLLFNVPSDPSFVDFPDGMATSPEFFFSLGADYFIESLYLTPGVIFGVQRPASMMAANSALTSGIITKVYADPQNPWLLEPGEDVQLVYAAKTNARWKLSEAIVAVGELQYQFDRNRRTFQQDPYGIVTRVPADDQHIIGFTVMLQGRF